MKNFVQNRNLLAVFLVSLAGALFSGYLTTAKLVTTKCVLTEGCYYILGYPTCAYGFVMFLFLLAFSAATLFGLANNKKTLNKLVIIVSLVGMVFSAFSTTMQLLYPTSTGIQYALLMPTCFYGFFMYLIIFAFAVRSRKGV